MFRLFLGVAELRVMPDHAHDVCLMSCLVESILHRFAIERQRLVLLPPGLIPGIECAIQLVWFDANQAIANDGFAGDHVVSLFTPTAEPFACFLSQGFSPIRDGFIAAHAAQRRTGRDAQHHRQTMAAPLPAAGIGNHRKTLRQQAHLVGVKHDLGGSCELKVRSVGVGQLRLRPAA